MHYFSFIIVSKKGMFVEWGSRQFVDSGGWYDRDKLYWKEIIDVVLVAACAPPSGGRSPLTPRFVRHFAMLHVAAPDTNAMTTIFKVL